jgi:lipoprotein-anchoring transpeptidase ErfK/SrfK
MGLAAVRGRPFGFQESDMRGSRLIIAALVGAFVATSSAARAETFFEALGNIFGGDDSSMYQGQTLYPEDVPRGRAVPMKFMKQTVSYNTSEKPGTIIIDTKGHFLYFVTGGGRAIRYGVGVGRTGFGWKGTVRIGNKAEWPDWHPPKEMIAREAKRGHKLPTVMAGGKNNPLGARAMYLYGKGGDTGFRIHGTSEPWTIGLNVSSGCIRLNNNDVTDLYQRASIGAKVIVM